MAKTNAFKCRLLAALLALLLTLSVFPALGGADSEEVLQLTGCYTSSATTELRSVSFPFCDADFLQDDSIYNHRLARASLGMALSAFRDWKQPIGHHEDHIVDYLHQAGFTNLVHSEYNQIPTQDTIATLIGSKKIGDQTVIAVAVCGGGYKNEWKSNFNVGHEETRHQGFNSASQKVQQRIRKYLSDYDITGTVSLWISGYSRAGATTNITAADMTDSGLFANVYAYCFAPPRTTREPGNYDNIFNIVGATDPVPQVPLVNWGYQRYGTDLYTPSQEYDSNWSTKAAKAEDYTQQLTGSYFRNNPIQNFRLRMVLSYLLAAFPTSSNYQDTLEPHLVEMWGGDIDQMLEVLAKALNTLEDVPEEQRDELSALGSYLENMLFDQLKNQEEMAEKKLWDKNVAMADNLIHEHNPDVYVEWMFSADSGDELFAEMKGSYRFVIYGTVNLYLYDQYGFIEKILPDGSIDTDPAVAGMDARESDTCPNLFCSVEDGHTTVIIPTDQIYLLEIVSDTDQEVRYFASAHNTNTLEATVIPEQTVSLKKDTSYILAISDSLFSSVSEDGALTDMSAVGFYDPSLIIQLESVNVFRLSFGELMGVAVLVCVLLITFIFVQVVLTIIRKIRKVRRAAWASICTYGILCAFFYVLAELSRYHLNAITQVYTVLKTISVFWAVLLAFKGALFNRSRLHWLVAVALLFCLPADFSTSSTLSALFFAVLHIVLIVALILDCKPSFGQILTGLILWVLCVAAILFNRAAIGDTLWICIGFSLLAIMLPTLAASAPGQLLTGCLFFSVADILVGLTWVTKTGFAYRAISVALYLSAVFIIATSNWLGGSKPPRMEELQKA